MRSKWIGGLVALGFVAGLVALHAPAPATAATGHAPHTAVARKTSEGWPDTQAGRLASGWVEAFSTGEDAMQTFLANHMAESGLKERSVPKRVENYKKLRAKYGKLELASIDKASASELTATLMASDASTHKFVFKTQTKPPYKLISVGIMERSHGGHFGFPH